MSNTAETEDLIVLSYENRKTWPNPSSLVLLELPSVGSLEASFEVVRLPDVLEREPRNEVSFFEPRFNKYFSIEDFVRRNEGLKMLDITHLQKQLD